MPVVRRSRVAHAPVLMRFWSAVRCAGLSALARAEPRTASTVAAHSVLAVTPTRIVNDLVVASPVPSVAVHETVVSDPSSNVCGAAGVHATAGAAVRSSLADTPGYPAAVP